MCDCYYHKCEFCPKKAYIHIADYSADRDAVSVVCPWCIRKKKHRGDIRELKRDAAQVIEEETASKTTIRLGQDDIGRRQRNDVVLIVCRDSRGYGISLNQ